MADNDMYVDRLLSAGVNFAVWPDWAAAPAPGVRDDDASGWAMTQTTVNDCTVTVIASPASQRADVRITGDVDMVAAPVLAEAARQLAMGSPRSVFVDLAGVTFAGSALPNFLARAYGLLPRGSSLVVCRPSPMTRWVLHMTDMTRILIVRDHLLGQAR